MDQLSALQKYSLLEPFLKGEMSLTQIAYHQKVARRTLQHWIKLYKIHGLPGLEKKLRCDRGKHRLSESYVELIKALALQRPPLPISLIHRKIVELAKDKGFHAPGYTTVFGIVKSIPPPLLALAGQGAKAYEQKYSLVHRRESAQANDIWQADHTLLDIFLLDDQALPLRPWLTIILDDYSRAICGYFLSFDAPCAMHTALAFRQAIWRKQKVDWHICGIPKHFYTDHGSDFISEHIKKVCIHLSISIIYSRPGKPQGRGKIERFFSTLNTCLLKALPGYSLEGKPCSEPSLTFDDFSDKLENFILHHYHLQPNSTTGIAPLHRWTNDGFLPLLPSCLEELDLLLLTVEKPRKIRKDGIYFMGLRYMHTLLAAYVGESVLIRYDPRNLAGIRVYFNESFLCVALCEELAGYTIGLKDISKARQKIKGELYKRVKEAKRLVNSYFPPPQPNAAQKTIAQQSGPEKLAKPSIKLYEND